METKRVQAGIGYADSSTAAPSLVESWRPGGDSNPRSVPARSGGDVEDRSLLFVQAAGSDQTIQSPTQPNDRAPSTHEVVLPLFSAMAAAPAKKYRTLVADPPWNYTERSSAPYEKGPDYPVMKLHELMNMPVGLWAHDDAHLYLWTTNTFLEDSYRVMKAWGFEPRTVITWVKGRIEGNRLVHHIGTGYHFRNSTEHVLFGCRGKLPTLRNDIPTAFVAERHAHSEKPAAFYDMVESTSVGPFLDIFARTQRFNWDTFGNESFDFREHGIWNKEPAL